MAKLSSYEKGDIHEAKTFEILKKMVKDERFYVSGKNSKIYRKRKYYSKDREAEITFDMAIETMMPGSLEYSLLTLIECKNYGDWVQVGDVETFSDRVRQVGGHKGIMVTATPFQKSALKIAQTRKIGVMKLNSNNGVEWISRRMDQNELEKKIAEFEESMTTDNNGGTAILGQCDGINFFNFQDLLIYLGVIDQFFPSLGDLKIPYLTDEAIEERIKELSLTDCYDHFTLNVDKLCVRMSELFDVDFAFDEPIGLTRNTATIGKIQYEPLKIFVDPNLKADTPRWRFTVTHEIGHLVLHSFLLREYFAANDDTDEIFSRSHEYSTDVRLRMEIQANRFAALVLMYTPYFTKVVKNYFQRESIAQKGFIYLDHQRENLIAVMKLLGELEQIFGISKDAAKFRLKDLGLLKDEQDASLATHLKQTRF
jgi:Zn-dependent peptidase ImmA (M78 family)